MKDKKIAVEVKNLTFSYDDTELIINNISFQVYDKEFFAIIGPNGGGKTTLIKLILGLLKPNSGEIFIYGERREKSKYTIGYVPQFLDFDKQFPIKVIDVVLMGRLGKTRGRFFYTDEDYEIAYESLKKVDLYNYKDKQLSQLSGGQLQRVLLARALATESDILILDEPTASVDPRSTSSIFHLIKSLNKTIIMITHDLTVVSTYVERVGCLNRKLYLSDSNKLTEEMIREAYECPVELIAHGFPHRVFKMYEEENKK